MYSQIFFTDTKEISKFFHVFKFFLPNFDKQKFERFKTRAFFQD